ncbi:MAG: endo-1,4-beta-xylanase [Pirellulales bacterium]
MPTRSAVAVPAAAQSKKPSPWGISSSAGSRRTHAEWFPLMKEAGVRTVRSFPTWSNVEPKKGEWNWKQCDEMIADAEKNGLELNGIFMGKCPWTEGGIHRFPMENLDDWASYVEQIVGRYKGKVTYWEVWNEGNAGFNDGKHTTADYAKLVAVAYDAAKKANPDAMIGLSVASFNAQYLHQTMLELKKLGKPAAFDWLAIHPYEIADLLLEPDGEIPFLWMTHHLRTLLKSGCPERADCPIWITEIGHRIGDSHGRKIDEQQAARALVKMYVMAAAQGIERIQWFEARDPTNEENGFGVIDRNGKPRRGLHRLEDFDQGLRVKTSISPLLIDGRLATEDGFLFRD